MAKAVSPREKSLALVGRLVNALDDKKAVDIRIIDVSAQSGVTDFFVIATGTADQHLRSMRMELERVLDEDSVKIIGVESQNDSGWTVIDAFDVIIHLFRTDQRANYKFELLWKDGKELPAKQFITGTKRVLPEQAVLITGNSKAPAEKTKKPAKAAPAPKKPAVEKIVVKKAIVRKTAAVKAKPEYAQQAAKTNAMKKKADEKAAAQKAAAKVQKPLKPEKRAVVKKLVSAKAAKVEKTARGMAKAKVKTVAKAGVITRKAKRA
jgi:ribosome-associated protein